MTTLSCAGARKRRQAGQGIVEFGLAASFFILFLAGLMQAGYGVYCYNTMTNAAREAARYAALRGPNSPSPATTAQIQNVAIASAVGVPLTTTNITVSWPNDPNDSSQKDAQVFISYNYSMFGNLTLTAFSRMLVSQ